MSSAVRRSVRNNNIKPEAKAEKSRLSATAVENGTFTTNKRKRRDDSSTQTTVSISQIKMEQAEAASSSEDDGVLA